MVKPARGGGNSDAVQIEGVRELVRAIGNIDPALRKELGQRNKAIGQRIIDKAFPKPEAVGAGTGSKPKASATTNVLRIMAGHSGRTKHVQSWGKRPTPRDGVKRPYIRRSAEQDMPQIEKDYLDALLDIARKAGIETERN
jgi:hypothetical protein